MVSRGVFFGILDGGRGLVEALLATASIALFAYVLSQESDSKTLALKQVIYLNVGALLVMAPLVYWLLDDLEGEPVKTIHRGKGSFKADIMTVLKIRDIWLCAICIACGY